MIVRWNKIATHYYDKSFVTTTLITDVRSARMQQYLFDRTRETASGY
jgi:hypothetical protein